MSFLVSHSKIAPKLSFYSFFLVLLTGLLSALPAGAQTVLYQHNFQGGAGLWYYLQPSATTAWSVPYETYFDPFSNQNVDNFYLSGKVAGATDSLLAYPKNSLAFNGNTIKIQAKAKRIGSPNVRLVIAAHDYDVHGFIEIRSKAHVLYTSPNLGTDWATFTTYLNKVGAFANSQNIVPVFWFETDGGQTTPEGALDDVLVETVTNTAPSNVVLSSPVAGTLYGNTCTCTATATDNNLDRMAFYDEEVLLGEVSQSPYSLSVNLSSGNHRIKARAIDAYGMYTETAKTTVTINSAPQITGTQPDDNSQYSAGSAVILRTFANDINNNLDKVEFYVNSQKVGEDNQAPYQFPYSNAAGGVFHWYARAIDQMGLWTSSELARFHIDAPPSVSIISPANLGELGSCNVHIQANTNAGAGTVSHLNFYRNDTLLASDSTTPYEYKGNGWAPGTYTVLTRGYTTTGLELLPASITFQVVEANLQVDIHERMVECAYQLDGNLQPNQSLELTFTNWDNGTGSPGTSTVQFSTGAEATEWVHKALNFYDPAAGTMLHYRLWNQFSCAIIDSMALHPEPQGGPKPVGQILPMAGLKQNTSTGEYYYCRSDSANLAFTVEPTTVTRLEVLDPNDPSLILDTLEGPDFHLSSSLAAYNGVGLRALSPLGCAGEDVFSLVWGVAENPVVWADTLISYGGQPAIGKAYASGGTAPYTFTWTGVDTCFTANCDLAKVKVGNRNFVMAIDQEGCYSISDSLQKVFSRAITCGNELSTSQIPSGSSTLTIPPETDLSLLPEVIEIPVVFTILSGNNYSQSGITREQLESQIKVLNDAFSGKSITNFIQNYQAQDCEVFNQYLGAYDNLLSSKYNAYNSFGFFKPVWDFIQDQNGTELNMRTFKFVFPDEQNFHKDRCGNIVDPVRFLNFNNGLIVRNTSGELENEFLPENMFWVGENGGINPVDPERFLNIYIGKLFDYKPGIQPIIDFNYSNRSSLKGFFFGKMDVVNIYSFSDDCSHLSRDFVFVQDLFVGNNIGTSSLSLSPSNPDFNGELLAHEIGHFMGLTHPYRKAGDGNDDLDGCYDTGGMGIPGDHSLQYGVDWGTVCNGIQIKTNFFSNGYNPCNPFGIEHLKCPCESTPYDNNGPVERAPIRNFNFMAYANHCAYYFTKRQAEWMYYNVSSGKRRSRIWLPKPAGPFMPELKLEVNSCTGLVKFEFNNEQGCGTAVVIPSPGGTGFNAVQVGVGNCSSAYKIEGQVTYGPGTHFIELKLRRDGELEDVIVRKDFTIIGNGSGFSLANSVTISPQIPLCQGQDLTLSLPPVYGPGGVLIPCLWEFLNQNVVKFSRNSYSELVTRSELVSFGITSVRLSMQNPCNGPNLVWNLPISVSSPVILMTTPPPPICEGSPFSLEASSIPNVTYNWFLDNVIQSPQVPENTFALNTDLPGFTGNSQLREIKVRVVEQGCSTEVVRQVEIFNQFFNPPGTWSHSVGDAPFTPISGTIQLSACQDLRVQSSYTGPVQYRLEELGNISPILVSSGNDIQLQFLPVGLHTYRVTPFRAGNPCEGTPFEFSVDVIPGQPLELTPYCTGTNGEIFGVRASVPSEPEPNGNFFFTQLGQEIEPNNTGEWEIFSPGSPIQRDGAGFQIYYLNADNACFYSTNFHILGNPNPSAPVYPGLDIRDLAFVHSNIQVTDVIKIRAGARVYNRGQLTNANFNGSNNPAVDEVKWTIVDNDATSLTIEEGALVTAACDRMWKGIEVNSNGGNVLPVTIHAGAEISHAFKAIQMSWEGGKVRLLANEAKFSNNFISVETFQNDANGSEMIKCTFDCTNLLAPFTGDAQNPITSRFGINLFRGIGSGNSSIFKVTECQFDNLLIGIQALSSRAVISKCVFKKIRFKGINLEDQASSLPTASISECQFYFDALPHEGWARLTEAYCCGYQNLIPGLSSSGTGIVGNMGKGLYGICNRFGDGEIFKNIFSQSINLPNNPTFGLIEPARSQSRTGNTFTGLDYGIMVPSADLVSSPEAMPYTVRGNTFIDNDYGVYLGSGQFNLELKCNVFSQTTPIPTGNTHVGLLIGENASLTNNRIGGTLLTEPQGEPNSNYFPRTINATTGAIEPFPNYFSVWNESASQISYYNYANEDLGNLYPQQSSGLPNYINADPVSDISITRQNLENWCLEVPLTSTLPNWQSNGVVSFPLLKDCREMDQSELITLKTEELIPNNWVLACNGGPLDHVAFPIPRPASSSLVAEMVESLTKDKVYLGQSIPNPAQSQVTIPVLLSELKGSAVLEIFELATGKAIAQKTISGLGQHNLYFDVHTWAPGIYGYRIVLPEGKSPAPRKMVLVK